ncbi:orotidine-5'-phosphate decarboxylase [Halobacteriovorax sp.]|uniref:orotidine-5'-phosphate decarboxylase n=1 Tax=Halobacteriovorax sp. TaxID=2020862 RepID=UPI0035651D56
MSGMDKVYVALDNMTKEDIFNFLDKTNNELKCIKIGLELFNRYGRELILEIYDKYKLNIFLDLKLHDIPNTVSKSIRSLENLPISFLTIHISGGQSMLEASVSARDQYLPKCKLLGVSVLTSLDENDMENIWGITDSKFLFSNLFLLANKSKIDGVVCSANELDILNELDLNLISMCPGIRFEDEIKSANLGDQKRVLSPTEAFMAKATYLVIGRSITESTSLTERISQLKNM